MMRRTSNLTLALLVLGACSSGGETPGVVVLPGMVASVPVDPYAADPLDPQRGATRLPPEGTVALHEEDFPFGPGREEAARAGREWQRPFELTDADLNRGKQRYETFCAVCHGAEGKGDGPIIGAFPNPPSFHTDRLRSMPDGEIFHVITYGRGIMASYGMQVRPRDRWRIIAHIRSLQGLDPKVAVLPVETGDDEDVEAVVQPDEAPQPEASPEPQPVAEPAATDAPEESP